MIVAHILNTKGGSVYTVREDARVADAVEILNAQNIGVVVVVNDRGTAVGILSERDVVRRMTMDTATILLSPITKCMTANPVTCTSQAAVEEVMQIMSARRIRHIPVVDDGRLVGLVSIGDVVKRKIAQAEEEAAALRDYIAS